MSGEAVENFECFGGRCAVRPVSPLLRRVVAAAWAAGLRSGGLVDATLVPRRPGRPPAGGRQVLGGEVQTLETPGDTQLFTQPAAWRHGKQTTVFIGDFSATAAFALRDGKLHKLWENGTPWTSPIMTGGLLYVYEPEGGGIEVYEPGSPKPIAMLPGAPGHWNSPIIVDGHVIEPTAMVRARPRRSSRVR
jgi:hypothetical protein